MSKTMLLALGLALVACAQPDDGDESLPLLEDEPSPEGSADGCAARGDFDVEVFADEILPILSGEIDLNDPEGESAIRCTAGPCHGIPRPDGFHVDPSGPVEDNLERFACFVDLRRAERSQILLCPQDDERCAVQSHPGPALFAGPGDLNFERILEYIRASRR